MSARGVAPIPRIPAARGMAAAAAADGLQVPSPPWPRAPPSPRSEDVPPPPAAECDLECGVGGAALTEAQVGGDAGLSIEARELGNTHFKKRQWELVSAAAGGELLRAATASCCRSHLVPSPLSLLLLSVVLPGTEPRCLTLSVVPCARTLTVHAHNIGCRMLHHAPPHPPPAPVCHRRRSSTTAAPPH